MNRNTRPGGGGGRAGSRNTREASTGTSEPEHPRIRCFTPLSSKGWPSLFPEPSTTAQAANLPCSPMLAIPGVRLILAVLYAGHAMLSRALVYWDSSRLLRSLPVIPLQEQLKTNPLPGTYCTKALRVFAPALCRPFAVALYQLSGAALPRCFHLRTSVVCVCLSAFFLGHAPSTSDVDIGEWP